MGGVTELDWAAIGPWGWVFAVLSVGLLLWGAVRLTRGDATPSPRLEPLPRGILPDWAQASAMVALFGAAFLILAMGGPLIFAPLAAPILGALVDEPGAAIGTFQGSSLAGGFIGQLVAAGMLIGIARLEPSLLHAAPDASDRETLRADGAGIRRLLGLFAAALALMTVGLVLWAAFCHLAATNGTIVPEDDQLMVDALLNHRGPSWPLVVTALYVTVGAPLIEEIGFRGMIYPAFRRILPRGWAVALVGILFGIIHGNLATLLPITLLGAWLCLVRDRFGLGTCVALHLMSNAWSFFWLLRAPEVARHL